MSRSDKLLQRLLTLPKDLTYGELKKLLNSLGFKEKTKGKTSGSRIAFYHKETGHVLRLHKPHPGNILPEYAVKDIVDALKTGGHINE